MSDETHYPSPTSFDGEFTTLLSAAKNLYAMASQGLDFLMEHRWCVQENLASVLGDAAVIARNGELNVFGQLPPDCDTIDGCCAALEARNFATLEVDSYSFDPATLTILFQLVRLLLPLII